MKDKIKNKLNEEKEDFKRIYKEESNKHDKQIEEITNSPYGTIIFIVFVVCVICKLFIWD